MENTLGKRRNCSVALLGFITISIFSENTSPVCDEFAYKEKERDGGDYCTHNSMRDESLSKKRKSGNDKGKGEYKAHRESLKLIFRIVGLKKQFYRNKSYITR